MIRYPILAKVHVFTQPPRVLPLRWGEQIIERMGGGCHTLSEARQYKIDYYPTSLWAFKTTKGGVAYLRPEEVKLELMEILEWYESDDPMGATEGWPLYGKKR